MMMTNGSVMPGHVADAREDYSYVYYLLAMLIVLLISMPLAWLVIRNC
jgi:hypothetical protein